MTDTGPRAVRNDVRREASRRIRRLQEGILHNRAEAVRTLAQLRRCDPARVAADPSVWAITLDGLPDSFGPSARARDQDAATPAERALHATLVLYAQHQQSGRTGVHVTASSPPMGEDATPTLDVDSAQTAPRVPPTFGRAVGTLARRRAHDEELDSGVVRRLHQVVLADDFTARLHHLRGLIQLLRAESPPIAFDYGQFAAELWTLADPRRDPDPVFTRWARDVHARPPKRNTTTTNDQPEEKP